MGFITKIRNKLTSGTGYAANMGMSHNVRLRHYRGEKLLREWHVHNLTVNAGLEWVKSVISNNGDTEAGVDFMEYVAVGSSNAAPAAGQTALTTEISTSGLGRAIGTYASGATGICTVTKSFSVSGSETVEEAGLFDDPSAGTMLARVLTGTTAVANGDTLEVEWTITYTST
jgi:hypothetical protein